MVKLDSKSIVRIAAFVILGAISGYLSDILLNLNPFIGLDAIGHVFEGLQFFQFFVAPGLIFGTGVYIALLLSGHEFTYRQVTFYLLFTSLAFFVATWIILSFLGNIFLAFLGGTFGALIATLALSHNLIELKKVAIVIVALLGGVITIPYFIAMGLENTASTPGGGILATHFIDSINAHIFIIWQTIIAGMLGVCVNLFAGETVTDK